MPFKDPAVRRAYSRIKGREWMARETAKRRAAGLCVSCRTPVQKYRMCVECRLGRSRYYQTVLRPVLVATSAPCSDCGGPCATPGAPRCKRCSAKRANAARWRKEDAA